MGSLLGHLKKIRSLNATVICATCATVIGVACDDVTIVMIVGLGCILVVCAFGCRRTLFSLR